uniref:Kinesin motor domain-containing protein n=1 Tax=Macrostomum lignano TaxID=282301 RepID=A0A1I8FSJ7_9PLAT
VRFDAGADSSQLPAGHRSKRAQPQTVVSRASTQHSTPPLPKPRLAARPLPKRPPVGRTAICHGRLDFDDEGRPMPLGPGKSALMPQTNCSASIGGGKTPKSLKSSGSGFSNDFQPRCRTPNWEALEIAQPPEAPGSHTASSCRLQHGKPTPSKPATNLGDDADRMVGSTSPAGRACCNSLFG